MYSSLPVGGCLLRCFSVTLWFGYFQLETGCDSDCMLDCVIEWTNHIYTHAHFLNAHNRINDANTNTQDTTLSHTHRYIVRYTHTLRVSGNSAGFPLFKEPPEGERADDEAPPAADRALVSWFQYWS